MFKIKIENVSSYSNTKEPYLIRYEQTPDISKGIEGLKYHQSFYSSHLKASKVGSDLTLYFNEVFTVLECIYSKIKSVQIPNYANLKSFDFSEIEVKRIKVYKNCTFENYCFIHIAEINSFLSSLKKYCFVLIGQNDVLINHLFNLLNSLGDSFKIKYRSALQLSSTNQLNIF